MKLLKLVFKKLEGRDLDCYVSDDLMIPKSTLTEALSEIEKEFYVSVKQRMGNPSDSRDDEVKCKNCGHRVLNFRGELEHDYDCDNKCGCKLVEKKKCPKCKGWKKLPDPLPSETGVIDCPDCKGNKLVEKEK